jgi:hypothetical protein
VVAVIQQGFPVAQALLDAFFGHLVLAGGALCINREHYDGNDVGLAKVDADFFFVGVTVAQADQMLEEMHVQKQQEEANF